jgi:hypothetical protein
VSLGEAGGSQGAKAKTGDSVGKVQQKRLSKAVMANW